MTIQQRYSTILGVSLGAKRTGVAIISYGTLIHWRLHIFNGTWNAKKQENMLNRYESYIKKYGVKRVFIKVPPFTHHSVAITALLKKLLERCQAHDCIVEYSTKIDIKHYIPEVQNNTALITYVTNRFPILTHEQSIEMNNRQPYKIKMFEAVLAAHIMNQQIPCKRYSMSKTH